MGGLGAGADLNRKLQPAVIGVVGAIRDVDAKGSYIPTEAVAVETSNEVPLVVPASSPPRNPNS